MILTRPLVTGAAGFIGYHLCQYLNSIQEVEQIIAVDLKDSKNILSLRKFEKVMVVESDMNYESVSQLLSLEASSVFALAALNGTSRFYKEPFKVLESSTIPTLALLSKLDSSIPVLYSSSSEVYASNLTLGIGSIPSSEEVPLTISDVHNPRWSYAAAKIHGEMAIVSSSVEHDRPTSIVRYHNVYGPKMGTDHFIPDFVSRALKGEFVIQNPDHSRSFMHVHDAVRGTVKAILSSNTQTPTFHLGTMQEITIREAAYRILELMGLKGIEIKEIDGPKGSVLRRVPSIEKAKKQLGWHPEVGFDEGVKDYLASLRG